MAVDAAVRRCYTPPIMPIMPKRRDYDRDPVVHYRAGWSQFFARAVLACVRFSGDSLRHTAVRKNVTCKRCLRAMNRKHS